MALTNAVQRGDWTMQEIPARLAILISVVALALALMWGIGKKDRRYGLLDFLRGKPAPVFAPEEYTLPTESALQDEDVPLLERLNSEYAKLTAAVVPSVVSIDTSETVAVKSGFPGYYRQLQKPGLGSGVIVTPEGHVITNQHVVANKDSIRVTRMTPDGRREVLAADLVGGLASHDIAVLKIRSDRKDFPALKFADSSEVRVGQIALAIGNPYGLSESVTQGIISGVDRRISDAGPSYFQTDTPINPGNSGGPLVNYRGEIIGINSVVLRGPETERAAQNIGFAIPAQQAWEAFQIITGRGRPVFGYLGLALSDITQPVALALGMDKVRGAWVQGVMAGGPAAESGIRPPDVILTLNGEEVNSEALVGRIRRMPPGEEVKLEVWRGGKIVEVKANVGDARKIPNTPAPRVESSTFPTKPSGSMGLTVGQAKAILNAVGLTVGVGDASSGVPVEQVKPGGLTDGKVLVGDKIHNVNGVSVSNPAEFNRAVLDATSAKTLRLVIERDGCEVIVELER